MSTRSWCTQDSVLQNIIEILSTRICKKRYVDFITGYVVDKGVEFHLLGIEISTSFQLHNELVDKMLMFSTFHKREKPIHIHLNVALDRMLLRSQASLL